MTGRQQRFVELYVADPNATKAYREAYGVSQAAAEASASRLLGNVKIQEAIAAARAPIAAVAGLSLLDHVEELRTLREMAKTAGEVNAAISAEKARGNALGHQSGGYRPNLDDLSEAELEQVARGEWPERLRIA